ncbi:MAG TPA: HupE/UreJ family protein [Alphaproteobacteria bacterium]|nr:HupE/UreJ family protein [Alphaproteobacteria bacterium]
MIRVFCTLVFVLVAHSTSVAHELRPGFLEIKQTGADTYTVRFKVPARGDMRLGLHVRLPEECTDVQPARAEDAGNAIVESRSVRCPESLTGRQISIDGLSATFTDVVVRVEGATGSVQGARLTPDQPNFNVAAAPTWLDTARTYFLLGVEHILLGIDHLLFVLALLLLVRNPWMLVKVITAFTVAHSITLAVAALGWAQIPQAPVEAVIALSIMLVAAETLRQNRDADDLVSKAPWVIAFAFGLLHGLGFGGALREIGLPQSDVPLALLTFNLGVEAGQLLFVFAVLALKTVIDRLLAFNLSWSRSVLGYGIGSLAAVWFVQRVALML